MLVGVGGGIQASTYPTMLPDQATSDQKKC